MPFDRAKNEAEQCTSMLGEWGTEAASEQKRRSWRCQRTDGHEGKHRSYSGHRSWD